MDQLQNSVQNQKNHDDSFDYSLWSMVGQFYNRKMLSIIILVWVYSLIFIALAIFSGIKFFEVDQSRDQLMYAVIFICSVQFVVLMKIFAWQMIHRNSIKGEIKKLELHIAELCDTVKNK